MTQKPASKGKPQPTICLVTTDYSCITLAEFMDIDEAREAADWLCNLLERIQQDKS